MRVPEGRLRAALLLVAALVIVGSVVVPPGGASQSDDAQDASRGETQPTPENLKIVSVHRNSSEQLWPYTSRAKSFDTATLPINVVVIADASHVRYLLITSRGARWEVTDDRTNATGNQTNTTGNQTNATAVPMRPTGYSPAPGVRYSTPSPGRNESEPSAESGVVLNGTEIEWISARGSTRYTYIHNHTTGQGRWVDETYQLHDGTYFGTRYHARLYRGGSADDVPWTALQVHREHWDWFRLRHTVDSVSRAQNYFERQFFGSWFTLDVERRRFANAGALDSDGWVTVIDLSDRGVRPVAATVLSVLVGGVVALQWVELENALVAKLRDVQQRVSTDPSPVLLFGSLALLPLAVRVGSIAVEQTFPGLSPKPIAAVFYLLLVTGPPLAVFALSRGRGAEESVAAAVVGLGTGIITDYLYLGVEMLPIQVVVHRAMLLVALGVLAAGLSRTAASSDERSLTLPVVVGIASWIGVLLIPLLDVY